MSKTGFINCVVMFQADAAKITQLHKSILHHARASLKEAIEVGRILMKVKNNLEHGEWLPWLKANVPFSERTTQRYISVYDRRAELKSVTMTDLTDAYTLIAGTGQRKTRKSGQRAHDKYVEVEPVEPTEMFHEWPDGARCKSERILPVALERIYNQISGYQWGLCDFIIELDRELGRAKLKRIAAKVGRKQLAYQKIREQILAPENPSDRASQK